MSELLDVRDDKGRFGKGNKVSKGRAPRAVEAAYLAAMTTACSIDDWLKITERAVKDAKGGDQKAREWLAKHLIGDKQAVTAIQVNQYDSGQGEITVDTLSVIAQLLTAVAVDLSDNQRLEFNDRLLSLTKLISPPAPEDEDRYSVDEHGIVDFKRNVDSYSKT